MAQVWAFCYLTAPLILEEGDNHSQPQPAQEQHGSAITLPFAGCRVHRDTPRICQQTPGPAQGAFLPVTQLPCDGPFPVSLGLGMCWRLADVTGTTLSMRTGSCRAKVFLGPPFREAGQRRNRGQVWPGTHPRGLLTEGLRPVIQTVAMPTVPSVRESKAQRGL